MLDKIKFIFVFLVSFLYFGAFYDLNYQMFKSVIYIIKYRIVN